MGSSVLSVVGTVGGAIVGSFIPGVGTALGAALGGAVTGAVFGPDAPDQHFEGPKMNDLKVRSSAYGAPIPLIYGRKNRVSGNIIWSSGLIEHVSKHTQKSGGKGGGGSKTTTTEYTYTVHLAISLGEGPCTNVRRIWLNNKLFWENQSHEDDGKNWTKFTSIKFKPDANIGFGSIKRVLVDGLAIGSLSFYTGSMDQPADPTMQSWEGAENVPRYKGTCYLVFRGLELADYGNATPNIEVELDGLPQRTAGAIVEDVCTRAGMKNNEFSTHPKLKNLPVQGYAVGSASSAAAAITPIMQACFFDIAENHGLLRFQPRGLAPKATIPLSEMAARPAGNGPQERLKLKRNQDVFLPKQAALTYKDPALDYQPNTQRAFRTYGDAFQKLQTELAMTLDAGFARKVVDRVLWENWAARTKAQFSTSLRFDFLQPTDTVMLPVAGSMQQFIITKADRGNDGIIKFEALSNDPAVYNGSETGAEGVLPENPVQDPGNTFIYVFNAPQLLPSASQTSFNYAMAGDVRSWRGGSIFRSTDDTNFSSVQDNGLQNTTGLVHDPLGDASAAVADTVNKLHVTLLNPQITLESLPISDMLNGANACWVGAKDGSHGEILQFQDAEPVGEDEYVLTGLLRGRRATEHEIGRHEEDEIFVLLERDFIFTLDFGLPEIDSTRWYKGVSVFQTPEEVTIEQEFKATGEKAVTRSPALLNIERQSNSDLVITWARRIKGFSGKLTARLPDEETKEEYEIDVLIDDEVDRTISTTQPTWTYTAAQQSTDGNDVKLHIYQIGSLLDRGHKLELHL